MMLITRHASRLILGKPVMRFDRVRSYDAYWSCGCRGRNVDNVTLKILWCTEHVEIFSAPDLSLQA